MPGTTSRLTRKAGTKNECRTAVSSGGGFGTEPMIRRTGRCTGTVSSPSVMPFGCSNSQRHLYARTWTLMELGGGTDMNMKPSKPWWNMYARRINGENVQKSSSAL